MSSGRRGHISTLCGCAAVWTALFSGCTARTSGLDEVKPGTPLANVIQQFGPPDRDVTPNPVWKDEPCPGATRWLFYGDLGGPLGRVLQLADASETVVCLDANERVVGSYWVQY